MALFLSESRGAWIGLLAIVALWGLWVLVGFFSNRRVSNRPHQAQVAITITILVLVTLAGVAAALTPFGQSLLQRRNDRLMVWQNSFDLASDYPFTGLGLGGFEMAYSSYVLLLHVGHTAQAHDLYLDVWIEQGLIGLVALAGLIFFSIQPIVSSLAHAKPLSRWQIASFAAIGVALVHGILDDPYYGYGGIAIPFLFIPFALIARQDAREETRPNANPLRLVTILGGTVLVLLITALLPGTRSAFTANMGALVQTRSELSVYSWPAWPIQDQVRRSLRTDLSPGIELYQSALVIDAQDVTANRRLGQIELSLGQYDKAQQHLLAAYKSAPYQRATRQLLGELYAISGDSTRAATLWSGIDLSDGQLGIREWWYEHIAEPEHAASIKSVEIAGR